ncbi:MAG: hypothetical protein H6Q30_1621 [Bacteroidetes bacterium]|nr:hypothetical protein [Bacteroidota bacterium]
MGFLEDIAGKVLGTSKQEGQTALINAVVGMLGNKSTGGLGGLVEQFAAKGLGDLVNSWVSTGDNLPATPAQIQKGLGSDMISQLGAQVGLSPDAVTSSLTELLPQIVDKLTPGGKVQEEDIMSQGADLLKSLFK